MIRSHFSRSISCPSTNEVQTSRIFRRSRSSEFSHFINGRRIKSGSAATSNCVMMWWKGICLLLGFRFRVTDPLHSGPHIGKQRAGPVWSPAFSGATLALASLYFIRSLRCVPDDLALLVEQNQGRFGPLLSQRGRPCSYQRIQNTLPRL